MSTNKSFAVVPSVACCLVGAAQGQIHPPGLPVAGKIFISSGGGIGSIPRIRVSDGHTDGSWFVASGDGGPAIAEGTYRAFGASNADFGQEYDYDGNPTGNSFENTTGLDNFFDGTTDGVNFNYAISYDTGAVLRFDRQWQNADFLFAAPALTGGITYDLSDNTIWANHGTGNQELLHYDLTGNLLGIFGYGVQHGEETMGLAFNPQDSTLWVSSINSNDGSSLLYHFDRFGNALGSIQPDQVWFGYGAEFAMPGPGAGATLAVAGLFAVRRRRA